MNLKAENELKKVLEKSLPKIIKIMKDRSLGEIEMESGNLTIEIRNSNQMTHGQTTVIKEYEIESNDKKSNLIPVISEMVGIFRWNKPGIFEPLVVKGENVNKGQILGYLESMKILHDLKASESGKVVEVFVEEGSPVEYGQALMAIEK